MLVIQVEWSQPGSLQKFKTLARVEITDKSLIPDKVVRVSFGN